MAEAIRILERTPVDLVITDLKMPKASGLDLIRHVRENLKDTEVVLITGYATIEGAVQAIKTGAEEYLSKPFTDEELFAAVQRALEKLHLRRASATRPPAVSLGSGSSGESEAIARVWQAVAKAASTNGTVLISGESGTGKELVARAIHYGSGRSAAPFVAVNCGGIPEGLLESELFGHVKGAFTGATESRAGFFQTADGGTIFLDEISDTSLAMQVKLLRVLQEKEVCMVGARRHAEGGRAGAGGDEQGPLRPGEEGNLPGRPLLPAERDQHLHSPAARAGRRSSCSARHFAARFAREAGRPAPEFSENALRVLRRYDWPGNVRELENIIQRLVVMTDGDLIEIPDLPPLMRFSASRENGMDRTLAEVEAEYIRNVLAKVGGNKTRAAEILGIDRKTLREKLKSSPRGRNKIAIHRGDVPAEISTYSAFRPFSGKSPHSTPRFLPKSICPSH